MKQLVIIYHADSVDLPLLAPCLGKSIVEAEIAYPDTIRGWVRDKTIFQRVRHYDRVVLYTHDAAVAPDCLLAGMAGKWLSRSVFCADLRGRNRTLSLFTLLAMLLRLGRDSFKWAFLGKMLLESHFADLESLLPTHASPAPDMTRSVAYLRPDIIVNLKAGGSVGHVAGVLNNLGHFATPPRFFTVDALPTVNAEIRTTCILPSLADRNASPGISVFAFSRSFAKEVWKWLGNERPAFIYQRHGLDNWSGAELALTQKIPFVLEYNGSEVWVARNWGKPVRHEELSLRAEMLSLRAADIIVVVSAPLRDELLARGIDPSRILVNPNGVDTDVYHPEVDGSPVRTRYGFERRCVIGFIGTFGKWHGAEVMAAACVLLLRRRPDLLQTIHMLFIGDGVMRAQAEAVLRDAGFYDACTFTGVIPQTQGPEHLAACDVLVAPHVPNADGSPFFGSPTKLFEYMAMGKAIAASALDQMDEVLEDNVTALKSVPGSAESLSGTLERLVDDAALRERLGRAARDCAVAKHTWYAHTKRIVDALLQRWAG